MPRIHLLDETLSNQIAAGEVIERPAAVVKELVENSLDAGARRIEIVSSTAGASWCASRRWLWHGARRRAASPQRHATSKLRTRTTFCHPQLWLSRRGAALDRGGLALRAAHRRGGRSPGTRIEVEGGSVVSVEDAGAPRGTTIEVRDLFWNVPAWRKFIKRAATEQAHALDAVLRLAVPRLEVSFTVREGERTLLQLAAGETLASRAEEALGRELRGRFTPFDASVRGVRAHGLAGSPDVTYGGAKSVWLFVNGRAVRDRQLAHAALRAYGEVLPHGRFPAVLIFLEVPPHELDVNVHPAKAEVRLADARAAYEAIGLGLRAVLAPGAWLGAGAIGSQEGISAMPATRAYALGAGAGASGGESAVDAERIARVGEALARFGARTQPGERSWQPFARGAAQGQTRRRAARRERRRRSTPGWAGRSSRMGRRSLESPVASASCWRGRRGLQGCAISASCTRAIWSAKARPGWC